MSARDPTRGRGRLRVTGFDADRVRAREPAATAPEVPGPGRAGRRPSARARFRRDRTAVAGLAVIAVMLAVAVLARPITVTAVQLPVGGVIEPGLTVQPVGLAPYDPAATRFPAEVGPSPAHPFGTDRLGRDVLSRVMVGGRFSLAIGAIAVGLAVAVGVPLGAVAGYFGGWVDEAVMRLVDVLYAFPFLVLAIAVLAVLGQGFWRLVLALVVVGWIGYARLLRGEVLTVREREYVTAARAIGARDRRVIARHVLPNAIAPVIVQATLGIGTVVLAAAALGFLGLGLEPGTAEWGAMLSRGRQSLLAGHWWITVFPGLAVFLFVLAINLVGDGLRDALDPHDRAARRGRRR